MPTAQSLRHDFVVPPPFTQGRLWWGAKLLANSSLSNRIISQANTDFYNKNPCGITHPRFHRETVIAAGLEPAASRRFASGRPAADLNAEAAGSRRNVKEKEEVFRLPLWSE